MNNTNGVCPWCNSPIHLIGSAGIIDADHRWEAETERYICDVGHMLFVTRAEPIEEAEENYAIVDYALGVLFSSKNPEIQARLAELERQDTEAKLADIE